MILLVFLLLILLGAVVALVFSLNALWQTLRTGLPYVTTPPWAIDWLANNLQLTSDDTFHELGCGDARVISLLAKRCPETKFIGIEIQWWPFLLAKWKTRNLKNVKLVRGDVYTHNLSKATVVYGFYITAFVEKLSIYLKKSLRSGTRIISFGFQLPDWEIEQEILNPKNAKGSRLLFYRRP